MKRIRIIGTIVGIIVGIVVGAWPYITERLTYQDWDLIVRLFTGIAPLFVVVFGFWSWTQNREKQLKDLEYKNDFYKKIINKRIEAYENLIKLTFLIDQVQTIKDDSGEELVHQCFIEVSHFKSVMESIMKCVESTMWLSTNARKKLSDVNKFFIMVEGYISTKDMHSFANKLQENKYEEKFNIIGNRLDRILTSTKKNNKQNIFFIEEDNKISIQIGITFFSHLGIMIYDLRNNIFRDFENLDKVSDFLNEAGND